MKPAFSVVFLTTLIGVGQGLMVALVLAQIVMQLTGGLEGGAFFAGGTVLSLVFLGLGLFASIFHLANPQRGWRAFTRWRTSWLSREVIALPVAMGTAFLYGAAHLLGMGPGITLTLGALAVVGQIGLFVCTGMVYACVKFIREWATPWTVVNYTLMGLASGFVLAAFYAAAMGTTVTGLLAVLALALTLAALATKSVQQWRNAKLPAFGNYKTAIGMHHGHIRQVTQGFCGTAFNIKEFQVGADPAKIRQVVTFFLAAGFIAPLGLLLIAWGTQSAAILLLAFAIQYVGLLAERWAFFAQGNHVQNLYYQRKA